MDPDDVFSASFDIYADTVDYGTQIIGFTVSFKQGNEYFETPLVSKSFTVVSGPGQSYQSSSSSATSTSGSNGIPQTPGLMTCLTPIILIVVVIVVGVLFYIRWKKRRKK